MRFKLILEPATIKRIIPINYQYELSAWIYKTIHYGNPEFSEWLHNHGYMDGKKQFRLFTFSKFHIEKYQISGDRMEILSPMLSVYISFYTEEAVDPFITGLFANQQFSVGDKLSQVEFRVSSIEKIAEPVWLPQMKFRTVSPLVISIKGERGADYLSPDAAGYNECFNKNLLSKYLAVMKQRQYESQTITFINDKALTFQLLSKPKSKLIKIKSGTPAETMIKGYLFDFAITAPLELMRLGYYAGFGEKNSLGFGSGELL